MLSVCVLVLNVSLAWPGVSAPPSLGWGQKWGVGLKGCDDDRYPPHVPFLELTVQISQETTADAIARKLRPYGTPGLVLT